MHGHLNVKKDTKLMDEYPTSITAKLRYLSTKQSDVLSQYNVVYMNLISSIGVSAP